MELGTQQHVDLDQEKLDELYTKAQELGFQRTKEELVETLFSAKNNTTKVTTQALDFSGYPSWIVNRTILNQGEIQKLRAIKILSTSKEGNVVEIWGNTFSVLRPKVNNKDVFAWKEWSGYEHVRYIQGMALSRELKKAGKSLFKSIYEAQVFLAKYIPWITEASRIQNFVELLWLEKSGYLDSHGDRYNLGKRGYAWLVEPVELRAWDLEFSDDRAYIDRPLVSFSYPVVVSQN